MPQESVDEKSNAMLIEHQAEELALGGDHELPVAAAERIDPALRPVRQPLGDPARAAVVREPQVDHVAELVERGARPGEVETLSGKHL